MPALKILWMVPVVVVVLKELAHADLLDLSVVVTAAGLTRENLLKLFHGGGSRGLFKEEQDSDNKI